MRTCTGRDYSTTNLMKLSIVVVNWESESLTDASFDQTFHFGFVSMLWAYNCNIWIPCRLSVQSQWAPAMSSLSSQRSLRAWSWDRCPSSFSWLLYSNTSSSTLPKLQSRPLRITLDWTPSHLCGVIIESPVTPMKRRAQNGSTCYYSRSASICTADMG